MNVDEAIEIIAKYLRGGPTGHRQLVEACKTVNADDDSRDFFSREFGLNDAPETMCARFDANVAELADMPPAQRGWEMAELVRHAEQCARCRRAYWEVRELWAPSAADEGSARGRPVVRTLVEGIRLAIGRTGQIVEFGLGPPSIVFQPAGATTGGKLMGQFLPELIADDPGGMIGEKIEWFLEDEVPREGDEATEPYSVGIRIRVRASAKGRMLLWCIVEGLPDSRIKEMNLVVSGRKQSPPGRTTGAPYYFEDRLAACQKQGIELPQGEYMVRIESEGELFSPTWEIPLSLVGREEST